MPERERRPEPPQRRRPQPGPADDQFDPFEDIDDIIDQESDVDTQDNRDGQ